MKNLIMTFFILFSITCLSQKNEASDITKKIKAEAGNFLLQKKEIESVDNLESKISIVEILDKKILGFNDVGIYRLFPHKSPSFTYIILKNRNKYSIIDLKDFSSALKSITKFLNSTNLENDKIVSYLEKILETYRNNDYDNKVRM